MCGITGFVNYSSHKKEMAARKVRKMADAIAHRGPDEEGFYIDEFAALGHKRLSIIDLSSGQQPMQSSDSNCHIVFNGEIYNFMEIQKELKEKGHLFRTNSDTEVILSAYVEWGEDCLKRFNGMFAFVIWNRLEKKIFAARDRVGKKPFYYIWDGQTFAFASEIKSLLAGGFSKKEINPEALDCYLTMGYIPVPLSIFKDVSKLKAAHHLKIDHNGIQEKQYWNLNYQMDSSLTMQTASEQLEELLYDAVKIRLISEVPLGAFLSGGIDSTLVVSYMAKILDKPVLTNTIGFDDSQFNEIEAANTVSDYLRTDHKSFTVNPDARKTIEEISDFFDEPLADSSALPTWHVCKMARKNVTVVLSGDGGDENFGGYTFRYCPHLMESKIRNKIPTPLRSSLFSLIGSVYPGTSKLPKFLRLKTIFENLACSDAEAFYKDLVWLRTDNRNKLYCKQFMEQLKGFSPSEMVIPLYKDSSANDPVSRSQNTDILCYMTDDVLVKVDRMSMAHALEVRNPLLDYRVMEFAAKLPLSLKLNANKGKLLLRHMSKTKLPENILNLPKKGFSIPAAHWLRNELKDHAQEAIFKSEVIQNYLNTSYLDKIWCQHQRKLYDHSVIIWGLMMLSEWEKRYL